MKNDYEMVYQADIGCIVKDKDNRLIYQLGKTSEGFCYKDLNAFQNEPDKICYISEYGSFSVLSENDIVLYVDELEKNKEQLINAGGISTANSIKEEIKSVLQADEYFYEYQKNGMVNTISAKNFDDKLINNIAEDVFDNVNWECTSSYILETDWQEDVNYYYKNKLIDKSNDDYEL